MFRNTILIFLKAIFGFLFKVRVEGNLKNLEQDKLLIIANHDSWLDGLLLGIFLPVKPVFVVYTGITGKWFFRMALSLVDYLKVDTTSPMAMKKVTKLLESGRPVVIFPEGRLSTTGSLMKVYEGPALAAIKSNATVLPVRLDGTGKTIFTRLKGKHPRKLFPQITISIQEPIKMDIKDIIPVREKRKRAGKHMQEIMQKMLFTSDVKYTLYKSLLNAASTYGYKRDIMVDIKQLADETKTMPDYKYKDLVKMTIGSAVLLEKYTKKNENVGILMPNLAVTVGMLIGLSARGRTPAMLNYKAGTAAIQNSCIAADIKTIITSRDFLEKDNLVEDIEALEGVDIIYMEDIKDSLSLSDKTLIALYMLFPSLFEANDDIEKTAVILFTSGSEGKPKGVALSHKAISANISQIKSVFDFTAEEKVLNALPIFHSFGLTGGTLLPLFSGLHLVLYVSPLHYKVIPELAYDNSSTVLFGTSTFLGKYGEMAHSYDFFRLKYVIAGAEKLSENVKNIWFEKFGIRILEGYGATETAPVIAVNNFMDYKSGTVGKVLPGIEYKVIQVNGIEKGGQLFVKGPNIMNGYFRYEKPGELEKTFDSEHGEGWYDTGDIVYIDDEGFVHILDRVKRFAKISGEMVSLSVIEKLVKDVSPNANHAIVNIPDEKRGEALILFTTDSELQRSMLLEEAKKTKTPEIGIPKKIRYIEELPLLGTGKTDYVKLKEIALS